MTNGFKETRTVELPLLQATAHEFVHATGAKWIHFACEDENNEFAVIIPTVPTNETGAPHILEHCVLNGSKRYPDAKSIGAVYVTGGGAWTGWEYTWYFLTSPVQKDYLKLVDMRCDSVFEPLLAYETFLHQAHHLEFTDQEDPTTPLLYRGVIYNEQKGILGHPVAVGWQEICRALFPGHPYSLEHGGTPRDVPTITYEELKAFHDRHYHPANAYLLSWGDCPLDDLVSTMDNALTRVPSRPFTPTPFPEPVAPTAPVRHVGKIPIGADDDPSGRGSVFMAWVTEPATDAYESLLHDLIVELLRGTPTSPIPAALAASGLGSAVAETYDKYGIRLVRNTVATGLDGCDAKDADAMEAIVMDTLRKVADDGFDDEAVDAALNRLEFRRRTLTSMQGHEGSPGGFFIEHVNTPWVAGGDPLARTSMDADLERFASERANGRPLEDRLRRWYIDNPFRALVIVEPEPGADVALEREEREKLEALAASMSDEDKQRVIEDTRRVHDFLAKRGEAASAPPAGHDVTRKEPPSSVRLEAAGVETDAFATRTNGITYVDLYADLGSLPEELWDYVHLFSAALPGAGQTDQIGIKTGGIDTDVLVPVCGDGDQHLRMLRIGGRALERRQDDLVSLLGGLVRDASFTTDMLRSVIDASLSHAEQWVFIDAPGYLRRLAGSHLRKSWELRSRVDGFGQLETLRRLAKASDSEIGDVVGRLGQIRNHVANRGVLTVVVCASGKEAIDAVLPSLERELSTFADGGAAAGALPEAVDVPNVAIARTFGQPTAFNCEVWTAPSWSHADGPAIVAGGVLASRHVRSEVTRKGTAYSATSEVSDMGSIVCWSIRDPNIARTYNAFEEAIERLKRGEIDADELQLAKSELVVLSDPSGTPVERSRLAFVRAKAGIDADARARFFERLQSLTAADVQKAATTHLTTSARASLASAEGAERAASEGRPFDSVTEI